MNTKNPSLPEAFVLCYSNWGSGSLVCGFPICLSCSCVLANALPIFSLDVVGAWFFCLPDVCVAGSIMAYLSPRSLASFPVTDPYKTDPEHGWCSLQIDREGRRLFVFNANALRILDLSQSEWPCARSDTSRMRFPISHEKPYWTWRSCYWSDQQRQLYLVAADWVECFAEEDRVWFRTWRTLPILVSDGRSLGRSWLCCRCCPRLPLSERRIVCDILITQEPKGHPAMSGSLLGALCHR